MMSDSDVSGSCDRGGHGCESVGSGSGAGIGLATYELGWCWWCAKFPLRDASVLPDQTLRGKSRMRFSIRSVKLWTAYASIINPTGNDQKTLPSKPSQDRPTPGRDKFLNPI